MHHPTDKIAHTTAFVTPVMEHWLEREIAQWVHHEGLEEEGNILFNHALNTFYLRLYGRKEGNVLFNDALNTFYLWLYGVGHMVKDHSANERKPAATTWATLSD